MIIEERIDGTNLIKTYSNLGMLIRQETGEEYAEAVDIQGLHTYTETTTPIDPVDPEEEATSEDFINALHNLGVKTE